MRQRTNLDTRSEQSLSSRDIISHCIISHCEDSSNDKWFTYETLLLNSVFLLVDSVDHNTYDYFSILVKVKLINKSCKIKISRIRILFCLFWLTLYIIAPTTCTSKR